MTPEEAVANLIELASLDREQFIKKIPEFNAARARVLSMMRRDPFGRCPKPAECVAMSTSTKDGWTSECQSCGWKVANGVAVSQDPADTAASVLADVQRRVDFFAWEANKLLRDRVAALEAR